MQNRKLGRGVCGGWLLVLSIAAGCGLDTSGAGGGSLDGRTFLLESAQGFEPVTGTTVRLRFEGDELSFSAGCNSHGGHFVLSGGRLVVMGLGSTDIGCDQPLHAQDDWLAAFITSSPRVIIEGDQLTLIGDDATLVFLDREVADPDRPLEGTLWIVDTIIANGGASSIAGNIPPEIHFDAVSNGWHAFSGCTNFGGEYSAEGDAVTIDNTSLAGCNQPLGPVDLHIQRMLSDGVVTFEITADRLELTRGDIGIGAHAE